MNHEQNTPDLDDLKQVLAKSFDGSEGDDVPPMPEGLRDRIADQYGRAAAPAAVRSTGESLFARISELFRKPAFAVAAAAVVMLVIATSVLNRPDRATVFRGGGPGSEVTLVLHRVDAPTTASIKAAGFDGEALTETRNPDELGAVLAAPGAHIVIDGGAAKILGYLPGEAKPSIEEELPGDPAALAARVAAVQAVLLK